MGAIVRQVRRILRRFVRHRTSEVIVGDLEVVSRGDCLAVADPGAHDMSRESLGELGLARRSQIVEESRPGLDPRTVKDSQELSPKVGVGLAIPSDHPLGAGFGKVPRIEQESP